MGAIISYFAIALNIIMGLIYTPWMAENIGQSNYGLYTMANSLISMFLVDFGISAAVTRFVAKYNAELNQNGVDNFLGLIYKLYIGIDALICMVLIIAFFFVDTIYGKLTAGEIAEFKALYVIISVYSVATFPFVTLNGILNAYEEFIVVKVCELANKALTIALTIVIILNGGGVRGLVLMQAMSGMITFGLRFYAVKRRTPVKVNFRFRDKAILKEIFGFSVWSTVTSISQRFIINIVPSLIGSLSGAADAAIFGVALTIEGYYYTIANAINGFFLPKISRILKGTDKEQNLLVLMIRVGRVQVYVLGLILLGFIALGSDFISLWMGEEYEKAYLCAILLIAPSFVSWPQQIATTALIAENRVKEQAIINVFTAVIGMIVGSISIAALGTVGAALGICLAYSFRVVATNFIYVKFLKLDLKTFFSQTFLSQGKFYVPMAVVFVALLRQIHLDSWAMFSVATVFVCVIYGAVMYLLSFNEFEKTLVKRLIHFKRRRP